MQKRFRNGILLRIRESVSITVEILLMLLGEAAAVIIILLCERSWHIQAMTLRAQPVALLTENKHWSLNLERHMCMLNVNLNYLSNFPLCL